MLSLKVLVFKDFNVMVILAFDAEATSRIQRKILTVRMASCIKRKAASSMPDFPMSNKLTERRGARHDADVLYTRL
jgi:hypothetical protein